MCKSLNKDNEFYHYLHNRNNCEWGQFVDLENENITKDKKYIQITQRLEYIYNNKKQYTQFSTPLYIRKDQYKDQYKDPQYKDQYKYPQYKDQYKYPQYKDQYKYPQYKYQYNKENDHQKCKDQYNKENKYIINTVNIQNIQINNNNNVIEIIFQILNTVINYFCKEK